MNTLITGAARRIGRAIAKAFADDGHRVVIHYRSSEAEAQSLLKELGGSDAGHSLVQADLCDDEQLRGLIPSVIAQTGSPPDCLINNAATYPRRALEDETLESLRGTYMINCFAPLQLMAAFKQNCRAGIVVNILDQRIDTIDAGAGAYALAKKSLRDATLAAARAWAPDIRVNGVAPGYILPPDGVDHEQMLKRIAETPMQKEIEPEAIASACLFLARSPSITGEVIFVDGGLHLKG